MPDPPYTLTWTEFQIIEVLKALKKRAQVLRASRRRFGEEDDLFHKQVAVDGLIEELKTKLADEQT